MSFGVKLKDAREEKGLSAADLAHAAAVTEEALADWETGGSLPDFDEMKRISRVIGKDAEYMLSGEEIELYLSNSIQAGRKQASLAADLILVAAVIVGFIPGFLTERFAVGICGGMIGLFAGFLIRKLYIKKKG